MLSIAEARPPYVRFITEAVKDTPRSIELGRNVTKDVDYACIRQVGSKDELKIKAGDWLTEIKRKSLEGTHDAYPLEWVKQFEGAYDAFKNGQDGPINGTSVKQWALLSPSQAQNFISIGIMAIEDVANMTEDAMRLYGMGARELKEQAKEWMAGKEVAAVVQAENEELKKRIAEMSERLAALEDKPKRGRPAKAA